jgi:hypothetical protein
MAAAAVKVVMRVTLPATGQEHEVQVGGVMTRENAELFVRATQMHPEHNFRNLSIVEVTK